MDKNVNIKFNATDGGSFEKFANKYKDLLKGMSGGSGNYNTNKSYVFSEMEKELEFYNKKIQKEKELFDLKKRQMAELGNMSNKAYNDYNSKKIGRQEYENIEAEVKKREAALLKGTGRRNFNTYSKSATSNIDALQGNLNTKAAFMDETNQLLRQILNLDREEAIEKIREIHNNKSATPAEKLASELADQQIKFEKGRQPKEKTFLNSLMSFDNLKSVLGTLNQYSKSSNGVDTIGATGANIGQLLGTAIGAIAGSFLGPEGTVGGGLLGSNIGGEIGKTIGGGLGDIEQKRVESMMEYEKDLNLYKARTGIAGTLFNSVASMGMNPGDLVNLTTNMATRAGSRTNAMANGYSAAILDKGFGIDQGTSGQLVELMRSMHSTDRTLMNLVGGVWDKGQSIFRGDRTYLNEFMTRNFASLQKDLSRNQTSVSSGTTFDLIKNFDSLGGQFSATHGNAPGLLSQINNALINPTSDNTNALSFAALRQMNPGGGIFDILKTRQKGLGAKGYLPAMLKMVDQIGGSEDMRKMNLAGMLGMTDNLDAVDTLYKNRGKIINGKISSSELRAMSTNDTSVRGMANDNTTLVERNAATLNEAYLRGSTEAIERIASNINSALKEALNGTVVKIDGQNRLYIDQVKVNTTQKPTLTKKVFDPNQGKYINVDATTMPIHSQSSADKF